MKCDDEKPSCGGILLIIFLVVILVWVAISFGGCDEATLHLIGD